MTITDPPLDTSSIDTSKVGPPRVGVGVFIFDDAGKFIVGERKGSHGAGTLALPGGHLEPLESFSQCVSRESLEETGLMLRDIRFLTVTNDVMIPEARAEGEEGKREGPLAGEVKHYVTIFMGAKREDRGREPEVLEPHKCVSWSWTSWSQLKEQKGKKLFLPLVNLIEQCEEKETRQGKEKRGWGPWEMYLDAGT